MPHSLTPKQIEYLEFLRSYIGENQRSPRLEELADHFEVKPPTSHKTLKALMKKGFLYFGRDSESGFFIRLIEGAGSVETVMEVPMLGKVNKLGEVYGFPKKHGHFVSVFVGVKPENVGALIITEDIPQANMIAGDLLIFDIEKKPQPGDISILVWEDQRFLIKIHSFTYDPKNVSLELAIDYPMPEAQQDGALHKWVNWMPLALEEGRTDEYFQVLASNQELPQRSIPVAITMGVALRLSRQLAW